MIRLATNLPALLLALGLAISISPAEAADESGPAFDCGRSFGKVEELICDDAGLAALDRRITKRFAEAVKALRGGADGKEAVATLRAEQRGWISGRNECWKADDLRSCTESAYLTREGFLVATYMLGEPAATARYTCNANPADEFFAFFYDTELPSVRVERGDSIDAGTQIPSASGARYALSFGKALWLKGDEAQLVWPEGQENACRTAARDG
ncbi:MAG: MliC family protein [Pseudomonadota bacterium]